MSEDRFTDGPRWAARVSPHKIRRLYEQEAKGLTDEVLVDEVGIALFLRCQSILTVTEAAAGRVCCPRCEEIIVFNGGMRDVVRCDCCGWQTVWEAYHKTYKGKQLFGGAALFAFKAFVENYPAARTSADRLLLIDRLLHIFHGELAGQYYRTAGCNLIAGKNSEILELLDTLAYGEGSRTELKQEYEEWKRKAEQGIGMVRETLARSRQRRGENRTGD